MDYPTEIQVAMDFEAAKRRMEQVIRTSFKQYSKTAFPLHKLPQGEGVFDRNSASPFAISPVMPRLVVK